MHMRVLLDHSAVEIYIGSGEVLSTRVYRCEHGNPSVLGHYELTTVTCLLPSRMCCGQLLPSLVAEPPCGFRWSTTSLPWFCGRGHPPPDADAGVDFVAFGGTAHVAMVEAWEMGTSGSPSPRAAAKAAAANGKEIYERLIAAPPAAVPSVVGVSAERARCASLMVRRPAAASNGLRTTPRSSRREAAVLTSMAAFGGHYKG